MSLWGMSRGEIIFLMMILALVFGWAHIPRLGARIGALFDKR
jgi:hypothetical protein